MISVKQETQASSSQRIHEDSRKRNKNGKATTQPVYIGNTSISKKKKKKKKDQNPRRSAEKRENRGAWAVTWAARKQTERLCLIDASYHSQTKKDKWQPESILSRQRAEASPSRDF
jgi:invasion protein IalB